MAGAATWAAFQPGAVRRAVAPQPRRETPAGNAARMMLLPRIPCLTGFYSGGERIPHADDSASRLRIDAPATCAGKRLRRG